MGLFWRTVLWGPQCLRLYWYLLYDRRGHVLVKELLEYLHLSLCNYIWYIWQSNHASINQYLKSKFNLKRVPKKTAPWPFILNWKEGNTVTLPSQATSTAPQIFSNCPHGVPPQAAPPRPAIFRSGTSRQLVPEELYSNVNSFLKTYENTTTPTRVQCPCTLCVMTL